MIEKDTVRLLRECDAGVKMGIASIDDVLSKVQSQPFYDALTQCKSEHETLQGEIQQLLGRYQDEGKAPQPHGKDYVQNENQYETDDGCIRCNCCGSDGGRLQYGRQISE